MADQGRWFKLWISAPSDPDLGNLALEDFARWALLGVYLKEHGTAGSVTLQAPALALCTLLRLPNLDAVRAFVEGLRNVSVAETVPGVTYRLTWRNWQKYQGDFSGDRVRAFRERQRSEVTPKKRREERRREEKRREEPPVAPQGASHPLGSDNGLGLGQDDQLDQHSAEALRAAVPEQLRDALTVLEFLNEKTSRAYGATSATLGLIDARLREGWTVQHCKSMIARKWREWRTDEKMSPFVRPSTLFNRTKLESYMGEMGLTPGAQP